MRGRSGGIINPADIYSDVDTALKALSTLLDEDKWFFDGKEPGLFDAAVFGYVHLVMTTDFEEGEVGLKGGVMRRQNLVKHRERVLEKWHGKAA